MIKFHLNLGDFVRCSIEEKLGILDIRGIDLSHDLTEFDLEKEEIQNPSVVIERYQSVREAEACLHLFGWFSGDFYKHYVATQPRLKRFTSEPVYILLTPTGRMGWEWEDNLIGVNDYSE